MIESTNGFLIDDNLSEQTVHLFEATNSIEQDYLNVEQHVLQEAVYPHTTTTATTTTTAMTDAASNQEYNSFQYESQTSNEQFIDSTSLLVENESHNSFIHSGAHCNRNTCASAITNNTNLSSSNDINIVRMFRNGEFLSEFTLTSSSSPNSTTNSIRAALQQQQQQQSFNITDQFNQVFDDRQCQALSSLSNRDMNKPDEHLKNDQQEKKQNHLFESNIANRAVSLDQLCSTNIDENNNKYSSLTQIVNNIYTLNSKSSSPLVERSNANERSQSELIAGEMIISNSVSSPTLASPILLSQTQTHQTTQQTYQTTPSTGRKLKKLKPGSNLLRADFDINANSLLSNSLQMNYSPCLNSPLVVSTSNMESTLSSNSLKGELNKSRKKPRKNAVNKLNQTNKTTDDVEVQMEPFDVNETMSETQELIKTEQADINYDCSFMSTTNQGLPSVLSLTSSEQFLINNHTNSALHADNTDANKVRKMKTLPPLATKIMNEWFELHSDKPYPTDDERRQMAKIGQINEVQVKAWFANKRNRSSNARAKLAVGRQQRTQNDNEMRNNANSSLLPVDENEENLTLIEQQSHQENTPFDSYADMTINSSNSKEIKHGRKRAIKQNKSLKLPIEDFPSSAQSMSEEQKETIEQEQHEHEMNNIKAKKQRNATPREKRKRCKTKSQTQKHQEEPTALNDAQIIDSISAAVAAALTSSNGQPTQQHSTFSSSSISPDPILFEQQELMQSLSTNNFHMQNARHERRMTPDQDEVEDDLDDEEIESSNQRVAYRRFTPNTSSNQINCNHHNHYNFHHQQQSTSSNNNANLYQHQIYNELMSCQNTNHSQLSSIMNHPSAYMDYSSTSAMHNSCEMMSNKYYSHPTCNNGSISQYSNNNKSNGNMYANHYHQQMYDQIYNHQQQHQQQQQYSSMSHFNHMLSNKQSNNYSNSSFASNFYDSVNSSNMALSNDSQSTRGFCSASDFLSSHSNMINCTCNSLHAQLNSNIHHSYHNPQYHQSLQQHQHPCDTPPPITNKMTTPIDATLSDEYQPTLFNHSHYNNQSTLGELNQQTNQTNMKNLYQPVSILDALNYNQSNLYHVGNSQPMSNSSYDTNNNKIMNGNDLSGECNQDFINETFVNESNSKMNVDCKEIEYYSGKENSIQSSSSSSVESVLSSSANSPESLSNLSTYSSCSYNPSELNNLLVSKNSSFQYYAKNPCAFYNNNMNNNKDKLNANSMNYQRTMKLGQSLSEYDMRFTDLKAKEWCMSSHPRLSNTLLNSNSVHNQSIMNLLNMPLTSSPSPILNSALFSQDESNNASNYSNFNRSLLSCNANTNQLSASYTIPNFNLAKKQANNLATSYSLNDSVRFQIEQDQQFTKDTISMNNNNSNSNF